MSLVVNTQLVENKVRDLRRFRRLRTGTGCGTGIGGRIDYSTFCYKF